MNNPQDMERAKKLMEQWDKAWILRYKDWTKLEYDGQWKYRYWDGSKLSDWNDIWQMPTYWDATWWVSL